MSRFLILLPALFVASPLAAADRAVAVTSFDRIRVDGAFDVRVVTAASPSARIEGGARAIESVEVRVDGTTLIVRAAGKSGGGGSTPAGVRTAPVVRLATVGLRSVAINGGGSVAITGPVAAARVDFSLAGSGTISAIAIDTDQLVATLIGSGTLTLGGRAGKAQLSTNGPGRIDAGALTANDAVVRLDGLGETILAARYTATVGSSGLGRVTITGGAKCAISNPAGGVVTC